MNGTSERQRQSAVPRRFPFKAVFVAAGCVFALVLVMISPLFEVRQTVVSGNEVVEAAAILEAAGLDAPVNIFAVTLGRAVRQIEAIPYVKTAALTKKYPNTIEIEITERTPCGYVEYARMHTYLVIDDEGMVLGTQSHLSDNLPVIVGLQFSDFAIGRVLETDNPDAFETVVTLSQLFVKNDIQEIVKVDVSNNADIHLFIRHIDVFFGGMEGADVKIQTLKGIVAVTPPEQRGYLHMEDTTRDPYFEFLK